jgi:septal ring factor EnvC (AmiA/AmiB activator)
MGGVDSRWKTILLATVFIETLSIATLWDMLSKSEHRQRELGDELERIQTTHSACETELKTAASDLGDCQDDVSQCENERDELQARVSKTVQGHQVSCRAFYQTARGYCLSRSGADCEVFAEKLTLKAATNGNCASPP